jgi:hypothetical protein
VAPTKLVACLERAPFGTCTTLTVATDQSLRLRSQPSLPRRHISPDLTLKLVSQFAIAGRWGARKAAAASDTRFPIRPRVPAVRLLVALWHHHIEPNSYSLRKLRSTISQPRYELPAGSHTTMKSRQTLGGVGDRQTDRQTDKQTFFSVSCPSGWGGIRRRLDSQYNVTLPRVRLLKTLVPAGLPLRHEAPNGDEAVPNRRLLISSNPGFAHTTDQLDEGRRLLEPGHVGPNRRVDETPTGSGPWNERWVFIHDDHHIFP